MTNSIADIANDAQCYFITGSNTTEQHPVIGTRIRTAVRYRGAKLIVADPRKIDIADWADLYMRHKPGTDIALLNGIMHVIIREGWHDEEFIAKRTEGFEDLKKTVEKYPPEVAAEITGVPVAQIEEAARIMAENRPGALLYAMGITQHTCGVNNVMSCANLQMLLGNMGVPGGGVNPLRGQSNVQGACDLGGLPNVYSGYQKVVLPEMQEKFQDAWGVSVKVEAGLTVTEMVNGACEGTMRGLYVIGEDPAVTDPDVNHARHCLAEAEFLVVQDIFMSETTRLADVILPGTPFAEKEGTFTNSERRVQRVRMAVPPTGDSRPDWRILTELARRTIAAGAANPDAAAPYAGWDYETTADVMKEIAALTPIYAGVSHERLNAGETLQWPVKDATHPGTPILHVGQFSRGLGHFMALDHLPPAELPDDEYPLMLTTGRVLYHWHSGQMTRHSKGLLAEYPEALMEISPDDASALGVADRDKIKVSSRRGEIVAKAMVTDRVEQGLVFGTFHFPDASVNFLTNPALDPVAKIPEYKVCAVRVEKA